MPRNSSGVYSKPAGTTAVTQTTISSTAYNALADDIATEITGSLATDGTSGMESGAQFKADPGSVSVPGITFTGDLDTGLYSSGANKVAVAVGGVKVGEFDSTGLVEGAWTDTASASTVNIGAVQSRNVNITGTTTITAFDTVASGTYRRLKFAGALTLTHNGTSLILPGAANITTAAGDTGEFVSLGAGNWVCVDYQKATGYPVKSQAGAGLTDTAGVLSVTAPAFGYIYCTLSGTTLTVTKAYNMSATRSNVGVYAITFTTNAADANYIVLPTAISPTAGQPIYEPTVSSRAVGGFTLTTKGSTGSGNTDAVAREVAEFNIVVYGGA